MSNGNLLWSFISRALNCNSNLNLLSNQNMAIIDIPNPLKAFECVLTGLRIFLYQHIGNVINFNDIFLSIASA